MAAGEQHQLRTAVFCLRRGQQIMNAFRGQHLRADTVAKDIAVLLSEEYEVIMRPDHPFTLADKSDQGDAPAQKLLTLPKAPPSRLRCLYFMAASRTKTGEMVLSHVPHTSMERERLGTSDVASRPRCAMLFAAPHD